MSLLPAVICIILQEKNRRNAANTTAIGTKYSNRYWYLGKLQGAEHGSFVVSRNKSHKNETVTRFWYCKESYCAKRKQSNGIAMNVAPSVQSS